MAGRDSDDDSDIEWALLKQLEWYKKGYGITILEVVELVEDLISYLLKSLRLLTLKDWLAVAKCIWLRNAQIPKYSAKVKTEDLSNTLTLILSKTAQRRSSSVVSNRSIALITDKFGVASLTEPAILNDANVALVDAVHYSVVMDALTMTLIKDDDDLLGTVNSYIKLRRLGARRKTEAADSRHAKASGGRTKKDKDLEDSDTSSDVLRLRRRDRAAASQLKKTRDEEELAKAKKEKEEKEAWERETYSSDIDPEDDLEDEEATIAKDLLTDAYILYFKELLSDNGGIFANAMGMGKTRAMVLAVFIGYFCFFSDSPLENMGRLTKEEAIEMQIDTTDAISKALAAANKLVALRSYVLGGATKHCLALLAARFVIVCGFGKVDKYRTIIRKGGPYVEKRAILLSGHVTVWGRTVFDEFHNCKLEAWALSGTPMEQGLNEILIFVLLALIALNSLAMAKQWRNIIANIKHDASEHESSYEFMLKRTLKTRDLWGKLISGIKGDFLDILEKEGLDELEASRRVIFNCFEMQAIASYSALATLKAAQFKTYSSCKVKRFTLNSVKDLFTNLSKDYFLVREARAITKSSLNIVAEDAAKAANTLLLLKEVCAKILIGSYKPIVQAVTWLGLREKFGDESVLVMQGGMTQYEINLKLAKWRDLDGPWIIVALIAFAEAIILIEATHVLAEMCVGIVYFNLDSELELKVLGKQDVKTTS
ncbi:hypothetical protein HBI17_221290 [Parastagonospora nodorum]|nr:hypothetical protein HBI17_221290 [Parastagonospora nodorum]